MCHTRKWIIQLVHICIHILIIQISAQEFVSSPAVVLLESTEQIANAVIVDFPTKNWNNGSLIFSRPNLGNCMVYIAVEKQSIIMYTAKLLNLCAYTGFLLCLAVIGETINITTLPSVVIFPGMTDSFSKFEMVTIPSIAIPSAFILAAIGKGLQNYKPSHSNGHTVELVHVLMKNMENFLTGRVLGEENKKWVQELARIPFEFKPPEVPCNPFFFFITYSSV